MSADGVQRVKYELLLQVFKNRTEIIEHVKVYLQLYHVQYLTF